MGTVYCHKCKEGIDDNRDGIHCVSECDKCKLGRQTETTAILERLEENICFYKESSETHKDPEHQLIAIFVVDVLTRIKTGRMITEEGIK